MGNAPIDPSLRETVKLIGQRKLSPVEVTDAALARIDRLNPRLNALITVTADSAREAAGVLDRRLARRQSVGPLAGAPITVKDLIVTQDAATTLGSKVIEGGLPPGPDAPAVARLRRAGAIILGKANLHEVALGVTTINEHFGPARNPWDPTRIAGGSSGGSAVAVAADFGVGSVGTDTRGSIRIPAACCGTVGFKPTYGAVPSDGVFPLAATLDHVGPLARTVEDAAMLFGVMAGGRSKLERLMATVTKKPRRPKLAISEYFFRDVDPEIVRSIEGAVRELEKQGATVVSADIPELEGALEASRVIVLAEAIAYHDPLLRKNREGYGPNVRARLEGGYLLTALELVNAEERRLEVFSAYARLFSEIDILVGAVIPTAAPLAETQSLVLGGHERTLAEAFCHFNAPQNLTGVPALSVPCGFTKSGLPIAVQLIAGADRDAELLAVGASYQRVTDWHLRRPAL